EVMPLAEARDAGEDRLLPIKGRDDLQLGRNPPGLSPFIRTTSKLPMESRHGQAEDSHWLSCGALAPCQSPLRQNVSLLTGDPSKMIKTRPIRRPTSEEPQDYSDPPTYDVRQRQSINLSTCIRQLAMFQFRHSTDEAAKRQQPTQREKSVAARRPADEASSASLRNTGPQAACVDTRERQMPQYKCNDRLQAAGRQRRRPNGCGFLRTKAPATETKKKGRSLPSTVQKDRERTWPTYVENKKDASVRNQRKKEQRTKQRMFWFFCAYRKMLSRRPPPDLQFHRVQDM
ncbi:unnamed protein product, partial [Caenorhabditis auriculariae]